MEQLNSIRKNLTPSQMFFFLLLIPLISFAPVMYECCENFFKFRRLERPDYSNSQWSDFTIALISTPIIAIVKYFVSKYSHDYFRRKLKVKYSGEALELKIAKSMKNLFKIFYFTFITAFGLYVYSDTNYQSFWMFGSGDHRHLDSDWPYNKVPQYLKVYYMINMSYHIEDLLFHLIHPAQSDFFEMLMHHYVTLLLITGSYMTNVWNSGINVMIQMDNGDIFVGVIKAFMDFTGQVFVLVVYSCMTLTWIYFRIFLFTKEVIWEGSMIGRWRIDNSHSHQTCIQFLLLGLLILNIYWVLLFFRMGLRFLRKGEAKDLQNPVEDVNRSKEIS